MKSLIIAFLLFFTFTNKISAQNASCEQLKTEIDYLKKVLKIQNEPVYKDIVNGVEIKITKIEGSIRAQTIVFEGLITPLKPSLERGSLRDFFGVDLEGVDYNQGGSTGELVLYQDVPVKFSFNIERINSNVSTLRILQFKFNCLDKNTNNWLSKDLIYRNVKINWK